MDDLLGKMIICRDAERFMVVLVQNGEKGLLNLDTYKVKSVDDIMDYINHFHFGVYAIVDALILMK